MIGEEAAKLLWDAHGAAQRIARFVAGRGFDDFMADDMLRAAVERQFEIIGEAFAGLRRIDPKLVWGVIENHLPALHATLAQLLGNAPGAR